MKTGSENQRRAELQVDLPTVDDAQNAIAEFDADGHGHFRDLCLVYGDFHRAVFLQEIITWFLHNASKAELACLRKAVAARAGKISKGGRRGRPRAQEDSDWLLAARRIVWRRIVDGWTWPRVAEMEGMRPDKKNFHTIERTLGRRRDRFAALIWKACSDFSLWRAGDSSEVNLERLHRALESQQFRQYLWVKAGLFGPSADGKWIDGCGKIIERLYFRGQTAADEELATRLSYKMARGKATRNRRGRLKK